MFPAPFRLFFVAVPLLVAAGALAMAAFPRKLTSWPARSPDSPTGGSNRTTRVILAMRVTGVVVAALALLMVVASFAFIP